MSCIGEPAREQSISLSAERANSRAGTLSDPDALCQRANKQASATEIGCLESWPVRPIAPVEWGFLARWCDKVSPRMLSRWLLVSVNAGRSDRQSGDLTRYGSHKAHPVQGTVHSAPMGNF